MKKVKMILTNRYDPDVRVYKEAKYLVSKGFDVEILCWDREREYLSREVEVNENIKIKRFFPYAKYGSGLKQLRSYIRYIFQIKKYLAKQDYDLIHCHDLDGVIAGYIIKKKKVDIIFDMHEFYEVQGKKQRIRYIVRLIVKLFQNKSKYIIYVNDSQTTVVDNLNKKKLIFLPNYPDTSNFENSEKKYSEKLRISYIGVVRQFNELKNLLEACKDNDNVRVSIHGDGVAYRELNNIKGNYRNAEITGYYDFSESNKLYNEADVLYAIYPTTSLQNRIGYPVKLFEAIITKTPIIVSKGTVLEDFIQRHDIGFVVNGNNVKEIRSLIEYIYNNKNLLNKKIKNLKNIQNDYTWEEVVKNLDNIYSS